VTAAIDLTGIRYGRLVGLRRENTKWLWQCDCGDTKIIDAHNVRAGRSQSCGCFQSESRTKHGGFGTRTYQAWLGMKSRVSGKNQNSRTYYTSRGITACDRWLGSYKAFREDMGECPDGMTLDRENNNGNYDKDNCRWVTHREQMSNTRRTHIVEVDGQRMCLRDACKKVNLSYWLAMRRLAAGESPQKVVQR
jgi:hypothetical protein